MPCFKPATPGFLVTLVATGLLAAVVFSVPYIKSIYFLKATINGGGTQGIFTFGVLGFCLQLSNGTTCSKPSIGYELNVNQLLGDDISELQIPNVLVKWITDALVVHIVALVLAAIAAFLGLLAHVREMSMVYCSSFFSGFAAAVTLLAFIFDLVLFFVTKSRINNVNDSKASFGIGVWLTLAAWIILFLAGCFYTLGQCCIRRRPRNSWERNEPSVSGPTTDSYTEQMRLDAIKAENDRKARQKQAEIAHEYETVPLKESDEQYMEDGDRIVAYRPEAAAAAVGYGRQPVQASYATGYAQAPIGTRAVDTYWNDAPSTPASYPPQRQPSGYAPSTYSQGGYTPQPANTNANQYYNTGAQYGHGQYPTNTTENYGQLAAAATTPAGQYYPPGTHYGNNQYGAAGAAAVTDDKFGGHLGRGASYNSSVSHSQYSAAEPYGQSSSPSMYSNQTHSTAAGPSHAPQGPYAASQLDRSYTLGGTAYNTNSLAPVPEMPQPSTAANQYFSAPSSHVTSSPTSTLPSQPLPTPLTSQPGPSIKAGELRVHNADIHQHDDILEPEYEDSPPMYDAATAQPPGVWAEKH